MNFMNSERSTSRYILTALAFVLVVTAFILVGLNAFMLQQRLAHPAKSSAEISADQAYVQGFLSAREKYASVCPIAFQPSLQLTGVIKSVTSESLDVLQQTFVTDPMVDNVDDVRTILLTPKTEVNQVMQKDPAVYSREMTEFLLASKTQPGLLPPSSITTKRLKLSELKVGQTISIQSDQDVRSLSSITALSIQVVR